MAIATSPYFYLIQCYFPPDQWANANCISLAECPSTSPNYPACVKDEGPIICGGPVVEAAKSYGLFGILDACWDPALNPNTYFTHEQWAQVLDPNVNTWMASVIYERNGWRAWTSCGGCSNCPPCTLATPPCMVPCGGSLCGVVGEPIPHPRAPVSTCAPAPVGGGGGGLLWVGLAAVAFAALAIRDWQRVR